MINEGKKGPEDAGPDSMSRQRPFASDVLTLAGGTAIALVIPLLITPVITRLYGAEAYGIFALFTSVIGILAVISCLRYEMSIMLPSTDEEAANQFALSILTATLLSVSLVPTLGFFGDSILSAMNAKELRPYIWLIPPMVLFSGLTLAMNYWCSRARQFRSISAAQVTKSISLSGTQLGVGISGYINGGSLIGAALVGQVTATTTLAYSVWRSDRGLLRRSIGWQKIISGSKQYRHFPIYDVWSALIMALSVQLPIFIVNIHFSSAVVGYYALGQMVLQLPITFIGSSISQVFFQRAAEAIKTGNEELASIVESTFGRLIAIGLTPMLLIAVVGKEAFTIIFGPEWSEAGLYAQILSFLVFFRFVYSPISTLFTVKKKIKAFLFFNIILITATLGSLLWGGINGDIFLGLGLLSFLGGFIYIIFTYWILTDSNVSLSRSIRPVKVTLLTGLFLFIILSYLKFELQLEPLYLVISAVLFLVAYYIKMMIMDEEMRKMTQNILHRN